MREKLQRVWDSSGRWFLLGLPLAAVILGLVIWQANQAVQPPRETIADPPTETEVTFDLEKNRAYTAEDGVVVIQPSGQKDSAESKAANALVTTADLEAVWDGASLSAENYTLPAEAQLEDGSVGVLSIPKIGLSAPVYESEDGDEMESMTKGIAHFATTSAWNGNVGLCSHNVPPAGAVAFFRDLHLLEAGDTLTYQTAQGERQYQVTEVREIAGDDWSYLSRTDDNRITMITCITGKPDLRLMVQAKEI